MAWRFYDSGGVLLTRVPAGTATASSTVTSETSYGLSAAAGASSDLSRGDHTHGTPSLTSTAPSTQAFGDTAVVGTGTAPAREDHRHAMPADPTGKPLALTGATAATRYVGGTTSGAPTSGTFAAGDFVVAQSGHVWVCTAAGSPGTWADISGGGGGGGSTPGAWSTYTPTWAGTGGTTGPSLGNGTITGRYLIFGSLCFFSIKLTMGTTTTGGDRASNTFSLPPGATAKTGGNDQVVPAKGLTAGVQHFRGVGVIAPGATVIGNIFFTDSTGNSWGNGLNGPNTASGNVVELSGVIEID